MHRCGVCVLCVKAKGPRIHAVAAGPVVGHTCGGQVCCVLLARGSVLAPGFCADAAPAIPRLESMIYRAPPPLPILAQAFLSSWCTPTFSPICMFALCSYLASTDLPSLQRVAGISTAILVLSAVVYKSQPEASR